MSFNLNNRHLLSLVHHTEQEIRFLLDLSRDLKRAKYAGTEQQTLKGKNIALIFEKTSTRTRCAFEVAAYDQGAQVTYIDPTSSQIGHKESMKDTARVLGRMYDAIEYRGFKQSIVEELAEYAGVPVFNGLTDEWHPTQMLADVLTMQEHIAAPKELQPTEELQKMCAEFAKESGARILVTDNAEEAVKGVDYLYTDVWVSMGEPIEAWGERIEKLLPYQVNSKLVAATGNPRVKFLHCLPAFHNCETKVGKQIAEKYPHLANGIEVTEDVFESPCNVSFDQAENRMHTIKAVMVASLSGL